MAYSASSTAAASNLPPLFVERQDFWRPWWWLALPLPAIISLSFFLGLRRLPSPAGVNDVVLIVPTLLTVGVFALLRLETRLDAAGISYRFFPLSRQRLAWADVQRAEVRQYSPLGEYGGWGIRGLSGANRAYNVAGAYGLQLTLRNGHRLLLGTQQPDALRAVLANLPAGTIG
ncbi:hypothetical protein [Hymenobacter persicinus]|uniref:Uncharacterized protein n=1 Tax=Hymenobacter persicinus TaxID=2025506 RepID=A0A4Q5L8N7_9BACT|nr:hypothetical protein [Hymenobacter persicinus]RYU75627.1 hypothetical protein EWM57_19645 [Hymenobacter persicinus]